MIRQVEDVPGEGSRITRDPFPGARRVYVQGERPGVRVPMREIAVGEPDEMELLAFVRRGGVGALDDAVELVGERRPRLAKGEPVALAGRVVDAEAGENLQGFHRSGT